MFISDKAKILFFHVPKCAGSSLHLFLKEKYGDHTPDPLPPVHHVRVKDYLKYNPGKKDYFKFCFIRNPFDRLLSAYSDYTQIRVTPQQDKDFFLKHNLIKKDRLDKALSVYKKFNYNNFAKQIIKNSNVELVLIDNEKELVKFVKHNIYGDKIVIGMGAGTISAWMRNLPKLIK